MRRQATPVNLTPAEREMLELMAHGSGKTMSAWMSEVVRTRWVECFGNSLPDEVREMLDLDARERDRARGYVLRSKLRLQKNGGGYIRK